MKTLIAYSLAPLALALAFAVIAAFAGLLGIFAVAEKLDTQIGP